MFIGRHFFAHFPAFRVFRRHYKSKRKAALGNPSTAFLCITTMSYYSHKTGRISTRLASGQVLVTLSIPEGVISSLSLLMPLATK